LFINIFPGGKTPDVSSRTYTEIMREQQLRGEEAELRKKIQEKAKDGTLKINSSNGDNSRSEAKKRGRWDQTIEEQFVPAKKSASGALTPTWGDTDVGHTLRVEEDIFSIIFISQKTPADHRWDETPGHKGSETPGATPKGL
jgi:splicing factor 3B subunit 1